jgi:hypothetical protein
MLKTFLKEKKDIIPPHLSKLKPVCIFVLVTYKKKENKREETLETFLN